MAQLYRLSAEEVRKTVNVLFVDRCDVDVPINTPINLITNYITDEYTKLQWIIRLCTIMSRNPPPILDPNPTHIMFNGGARRSALATSSMSIRIAIVGRYITIPKLFAQSLHIDLTTAEVYTIYNDLQVYSAINE